MKNHLAIEVEGGSMAFRPSQFCVMINHHRYTLMHESLGVKPWAGKKVGAYAKKNASGWRRPEAF